MTKIDGLGPPEFKPKKAGQTTIFIFVIVVLLIILWIIRTCCKGVNFVDICRLFKNCCSKSKKAPENPNEVIFIQGSDQMSSIPIGNFNNNEVIVLNCGDQVLTDEKLHHLLNQNGTLKREKSGLEDEKLNLKSKK